MILGSPYMALDEAISPRDEARRSSKHDIIVQAVTAPFTHSSLRQKKLPSREKPKHVGGHLGGLRDSCKFAADSPSNSWLCSHLLRSRYSATLRWTSDGHVSKGGGVQSRWMNRKYALLSSDIVNTQILNVMCGPEFVEQSTSAFADCTGTLHETAHDGQYRIAARAVKLGTTWLAILISC